MLSGAMTAPIATASRKNRGWQISEPAQAVGVSATTVSRVFSRPERGPAATRERARKAAAEKGYTGPDPTARQLAAVGPMLSGSLTPTT